MLDWGVPDELDADNDLERYVDWYIPRALAAVRRETGQSEVTLAGYCLGGVMAALYAAAHEDAPVRNLILMATPLDFDEMGAMVALLREGRLNPDELIDDTGNVPADALYSGFYMLAPTTEVAQKATLLEQPLERRVRRGLPGDGAVVARPRPVPRRRLPPAHRALRAPERADDGLDAVGRPPHRPRERSRQCPQRDGRARQRRPAGRGGARHAAGRRPGAAGGAAAARRARHLRDRPRAR